MTVCVIQESCQRFRLYSTCTSSESSKLSKQDMVEFTHTSTSWLWPPEEMSMKLPLDPQWLNISSLPYFYSNAANETFNCACFIWLSKHFQHWFFKTQKKWIFCSAWTTAMLMYVCWAKLMQLIYSYNAAAAAFFLMATFQISLNFFMMKQVKYMWIFREDRNSWSLQSV